MANPVDENPELAQAIGRLTAKWALVERLLETTFSIFLKTDIHRAAAVFTDMRSNRMQRDVLIRLGKIHLKHQPDLLAAHMETMKLHQEVTRKRNEFAHRAWGWLSKEEREMYTMVYELTDTGDGVPYVRQPTAVSEVNEAVELTKELVSKIVSFQQEYIDSLSSRENTPPTPPQSLPNPVRLSEIGQGQPQGILGGSSPPPESSED